MAAIHKGDYNYSERRQQLEQNKPTGGLRSFLHRRNNSDGVSLMSTSPNNTPSSSSQGHQGSRSTEDRQSAAMALPKLALDPEPPQPRHSPTRTAREALDDTSSNFNNDRLQPPPSPTKSGLGHFSARFSKDRGSGDASPPKKNRSSTNIVGLLSRPRSNKNLKLDMEQQVRNKENRNPSDLSAADAPPTPIFAQMRSRALGQALSVPSSPYESPADPFASTSMLNLNHSLRPSQSNVSHGQKQRPKSFQPQYLPKPDAAQIDDAKESRGRARHDESGDGNRDSPRAKGRSKSRSRILSSITTRGGRKSKSPSPPSLDAGEPYIDPKDIDKHLEAMLDRRNIPENQRHKMRSLTDTIKMEFIRQDWAENEGKNLVRPQTNDSDDSASCMANTSVQDNEKKQSRGRSFTLSRNSWKIGASPSKGKKKDASVSGHTRNKSVDSAVSERPSSSGASHAGNGIIAKITGQQPSDFVNYLRKVQKPESVEVGKLHKLRLLLRNERVAWTEDFVKQGGMQEIVGLLHRIMAVEWREEHEDALLHENLLCLKALCTTAMALQYLHSIQHTLFPALIGMIFDPEKKGPSEFTTRNIITSVLFTYIQSGTPQERVLRAKAVLAYLRDPQAKEEERPVDFVLGMRRERPYRVWNKEVVNVTKEVFWIFLHQLNVVALPPGHKSSEDIRTTANQTDTTTSTKAEQGTSTATDTEPYAYMARHFPQERPPVPAAPYVGGVEWDATNYLASHLDIVNAIIACTPTQAERNAVREQLRISGWERCLGGSLRLCKEKFYPAVHDALRNWVAAAADDGWDVRDVRFGPPADSRNSSPKKPAPGAPPSPKKKLLDEPPPRLEMPKLDFMLDGPLSAAP